MAYFVVQRNADSTLSVPLPESFPTREAALAALSSAAGAGAVALDGDIFIADLDATVPVLLVQVQPAGDIASLDEQAADDVYAPSPVGAFGDEASLAAALKRAASSLEDEGIVAPPSVEAEPVESEMAEAAADELPPAEPVEEPASEDRTWPWANVEAYEPEQPVAAQPEAADLAETALAEEVVAEEVSTPDEAEVELPIEATVYETTPAAGVELESDDAEVDEPYLPAESVAEPMGVALEEVAPPEAPFELASAAFEPVIDDGTLITSGPTEGEDAYLPRPVILGDYADAAATAEVPASPEPVVSVAADDVVAIGAPDAAPDEDGEPFDLAAALGGLIEAPTEVGYEATGDLDLAEYTCQDCIYSNTCPKVGQATPADCGSFQWRSE